MYALNAVYDEYLRLACFYLTNNHQQPTKSSKPAATYTQKRRQSQQKQFSFWYLGRPASSDHKHFFFLFIRGIQRFQSSSCCQYKLIVIACYANTKVYNDTTHWHVKLIQVRATFLCNIVSLRVLTSSRTRVTTRQLQWHTQAHQPTTISKQQTASTRMCQSLSMSMCQPHKHLVTHT